MLIYKFNLLYWYNKHIYYINKSARRKSEKWLVFFRVCLFGTKAMKKRTPPSVLSSNWFFSCKKFSQLFSQENLLSRIYRMIRVCFAYLLIEGSGVRAPGNPPRNTVWCFFVALCSKFFKFCLLCKQNPGLCPGLKRSPVSMWGFVCRFSPQRAPATHQETPFGVFLLLFVRRYIIKKSDINHF